MRYSWSPSLIARQMQEEKVFLTGSSDLASRIANSLGLEGMNINALALHIQAGEVISAECRFFPTEDQLEKLASEVAELEGTGVIMGEVELFYSSELEDNEE